MKDIKTQSDTEKSTIGNKVVAVMIIAFMMLCIGTDTAEIGTMLPMGIMTSVLIFARENMLM